MSTWTAEDEAALVQIRKDVEAARNWYEAAIRTECRLQDRKYAATKDNDDER